MKVLQSILCTILLLCLLVELTACANLQTKITSGLNTAGNDTVTIAKDFGVVGAGVVTLGSDAVKVSGAVVLALSPFQPPAATTTTAELITQPTVTLVIPNVPPLAAVTAAPLPMTDLVYHGPLLVLQPDGTIVNNPGSD